MVRRLIGLSSAPSVPSVHPGFLPAVLILGTGATAVGLAVWILRTRWWKIYTMVDDLLHHANPDSHRFPQLTKQWICQTHWGIPRQQWRWLAVMVIHHSRRIPRYRRRTWRVVWRIWRHRHVRSVPGGKRPHSASSPESA
jgi:hypothetical protein